MSILLPEDEAPELVLVVKDTSRSAYGRGLDALTKLVRALNPERIYTDTGGVGRITHANLVNEFGPNVVRELPKRTNATPPPRAPRDTTPEQFVCWLRGFLAYYSPGKSMDAEDTARIAVALDKVQFLARTPMSDDGLKLLRPDMFSDIADRTRERLTAQARAREVNAKIAEAVDNAPPIDPKRVQQKVLSAEIGRVIGETIAAELAQPKTYVMRPEEMVERMIAERKADGRLPDMTSDDLPPINANTCDEPAPTFMEKLQAEREALQKQQLALKLTQNERQELEAARAEVRFVRSRQPYRPGFAGGDDYAEGYSRWSEEQNKISQRNAEMQLAAQTQGAHPSVYRQPGQGPALVELQAIGTDPSVYKQPGQR